MALNFPPLTSGGAVPSVGQQFYDAAADITWEVIERFNDGAALIPVWQIVSTGDSSTFGGAIDITAAPPNPLPAAGVYYVVSDPGGTAHVGFGNLGGATFTGGEQVIYTGDSGDPWIQIGGSLPESTTSTKGIVQLAQQVDVDAANNTKAVTAALIEDNYVKDSDGVIAISSDGNVGIGRTPDGSFTDSYPLQIDGGTSSFIHIKRSGDPSALTSGMVYGLGTSEAYVWSRENVPMLFGTNNVEQARIDTSGNLLIGGTLPASPNISLEADGSATFTDASDQTSNASGVLEIRSNHESTPVTENNNMLRLVSDTTNGYSAALIGLGKYQDTSSARSELVFKVANTSLSSSLSEYKFKGNGEAIFPGTVFVGPFNTSSDSATGVRILKGTSSSNVVIQATAAASSTSTAFAIYKGQVATTSIKNDGDAQFAGSVSIGGTAAANTIDEYEEGTWTPVHSDGTNTAALSGLYRKIGDLVYIRLNVSGSGTLKVGSISGLPFTNIASIVGVGGKLVRTTGVTSNTSFIGYDSNSSGINLNLSGDVSLTTNQRWIASFTCVLF